MLINDGNALPLYECEMRHQEAFTMVLARCSITATGTEAGGSSWPSQSMHGVLSDQVRCYAHWAALRICGVFLTFAAASSGWLVAARLPWSFESATTGSTSGETAACAPTATQEPRCPCSSCALASRVLSAAAAAAAVACMQHVARAGRRGRGFAGL